MPNATCFLIAYAFVLGLELVRWRLPAGITGRWIKPVLFGCAILSLFTHSLYLLDRLFLAAYSRNGSWSISWHEWGILTAWALACAYVLLLFRRSEAWIGAFVLPLLLLIIGVAIALPPAPSLEASSSSTGWRLAHGVAMTIGTMLVSLGFAMACMYLLQAWRLKQRPRLFARLQLPSLEYLQAFGRTCLLGSAASIGFGMIAGVIMNLTRDGRVEWLDRGILFSAGLFVWLLIASGIQWHLTRRGSGRATAWMNILSFLIVVAAVGLVLSTPHGSNRILDWKEATPPVLNRGDTP